VNLFVLFGKKLSFQKKSSIILPSLFLFSTKKGQEASYKKARSLLIPNLIIRLGKEGKGGSSLSKSSAFG
jgi:hypothetical protein